MGLRRLRETTISDFVPVRFLEQREKLPIPQPSTFDEHHEKVIRKMIALHAHYAESGPTFDPSGRYLCGTCLMRIDKAQRDKGRCTDVSGIISMGTGGCAIYERGEPGMRKERPAKKSQVYSGYGERPQAKGFGCYPRCGFAEPTKEADSAGRKVWCGRWGLRVMAKACCDEESGPDLVEAPGDRK